MILGALLPEPEKPAWFLPISGRLYFRQSQLPIGPDGIVEFRTKCELAVELLREQARIIKGKHLAVFDGGYALESVVRPLVLPAGGVPRIDFLTRLRCDVGCTPYPCPRSSAPRGSRDRSPSGVNGWSRPAGAACGRRSGRSGPPSSTADSGQSVGRRSSACGGWGWEVPVKAIVASVEGYKMRFTLVTSAVELTGLQMVELFTARFRRRTVS